MTTLRKTKGIVDLAKSISNGFLKQHSRFFDER